jgi:GT2 family glycosyltransferase
MSRPDFSIIIVNWKVRALLEKCLDSIYKNDQGINLEVIVVDNDSRDGTSEMVMMQYPEVKMIALAHNSGFAKANNLAISQARGKYLFVLNPDTEILPNFFSITKQFLDNHPAVSIMGPKILNPDKTLQLSIRKFPNLLSQVFIMLKLRNILVDSKLLANYLLLDFDYSKEQDVEQIMGAAMVIRSEVLDKIGLFDERFFVWFEEIDLCKRAHQAGFRIRYFPDAQIIHHGGSSFNKSKVFYKQLIFNNSLIKYFFKHKPIWQLLVILFIVPINLFLTFLYVIFIYDKE